MKESQIVHQAGSCWVADADRQYTVYRDEGTTAKADSSYPRTDDGLTLAKYRANYLARRASKATKPSKRYPNT